MPDSSPTEQRLRFGQGVAAVLVIAGFVFELPWMLPVLATATGIPLLLGPQADVLAWPFDQWIAARIRDPKSAQEPRVRLVTATTAAVLALATLVWAAGLEGVADLVGLIAAGAAALFATTGIVAAGALSGRSARPGRSSRPPRPPRPAD